MYTTIHTNVHKYLYTTQEPIKYMKSVERAKEKMLPAMLFPSQLAWALSPRKLQLLKKPYS